MLKSNKSLTINSMELKPDTIVTDGHGNYAQYLYAYERLSIYNPYEEFTKSQKQSAIQVSDFHQYNIGEEFGKCTQAGKTFKYFGTDIEGVAKAKTLGGSRVC